ncbi:hypothetical protein BKA56DRAFT_663471 [Ilyonectria sp. MPI-CAGE-AT-0026]|nr:hypothetical protein BKA56DRAFT_663471 [Ilyonectria sp. MPI-CAGE-AT-0026]
MLGCWRARALGDRETHATVTGATRVGGGACRLSRLTCLHSIPQRSRHTTPIESLWTQPYGSTKRLRGASPAHDLTAPVSVPQAKAQIETPKSIRPIMARASLNEHGPSLGPGEPCKTQWPACFILICAIVVFRTAKLDTLSVSTHSIARDYKRPAPGPIVDCLGPSWQLILDPRSDKSALTRL